MLSLQDECEEGKNESRHLRVEESRVGKAGAGLMSSAVPGSCTREPAEPDSRPGVEACYFEVC